MRSASRYSVRSRRRHRHVLEEVGAVRAGGAVAIVGAQVVHRLAEAVRVVLGAVEEEVLEEVREAGLAALLVARADVIPEVHADDRHGVIFVDDEASARSRGRMSDAECRRVSGRRPARTSRAFGRAASCPGYAPKAIVRRTKAAFERRSRPSLFIIRHSSCIIHHSWFIDDESPPVGDDGIIGVLDRGRKKRLSAKRWLRRHLLALVAHLFRHPGATSFRSR